MSKMKEAMHHKPVSTHGGMDSSRGCTASSCEVCPPSKVEACMEGSTQHVLRYYRAVLGDIVVQARSLAEANLLVDMEVNKKNVPILSLEYDPESGDDESQHVMNVVGGER